VVDQLEHANEMNKKLQIQILELQSKVDSLPNQNITPQYRVDDAEYLDSNNLDYSSISILTMDQGVRFFPSNISLNHKDRLNEDDAHEKDVASIRTDHTSTHKLKAELVTGKILIIVTKRINK
jgi:hypothetical protein